MSDAGAVSVSVVRGWSVIATVPVSAAVAPPAVAVTVAAAVVSRSVVAIPRSFVMAVVGLSEPAVVEKLTGTPRRPLPCWSATRAEIVVCPPVAPSACGLAVTVMSAAPAAPMFTLRVLVAAPENAVMVAVPDRPSPTSLTVALPAVVLACEGSSVPSVVEKVTSVPL